jgi:integrase
MEFWGDLTVGDIKRSTCEAYVAWRILQPIKSYKDRTKAPRVSDQTARRELEDLSAAVTYWDKEYALTRRPDFTLPRKDEGNRDALTRNEAARLLKASMGYRYDAETRKWTRLKPSSRKNRAHLRRFLLIGFYTGSRPGVVPRLRWEMSDAQAWVDLDAGIVYRRGRRERDHHNKRRPMVKIPGRLIAHLRRWRRLDAATFGNNADNPGTVIHHGGHALAGRIRTGFEGVARDAGLDPEILTPHWMRHTCATWLMENDVPVWEAAGYLGMTTEMLQRNYGHHRPSHQAAARAALGGGRKR